MCMAPWGGDVGGTGGELERLCPLLVPCSWVLAPGAAGHGDGDGMGMQWDGMR